MKSIAKKSILIALLLISSSSIAYAAHSESDIKAFKNSCMQGFEENSKPQSKELKQFGANTCDCAAEEYVDLMEKGKKLSSQDEDQLLAFCMNKSLLIKTSYKLVNASNINSSIAENTCKQTFTGFAAQTKDSNPEIEKFCACSSADLSNSLNNHLSDNELAKNIDKIAYDCSEYKNEHSSI